MPRRYAYAVLYTDDALPAHRYFIICLKRMEGYFFWDNKTNTGVLKPQGEPLNGGGGPCLPGGERKPSESIEEAAIRELVEETNINIGLLPSATNDWGTYSAAYFNTTEENLREFENYLENICLPDAEYAARDIYNKIITDYDQIRPNYPAAPLDNELELVRIWDILNPKTWQTIQGWANPPVDWYRDILTFLRNNVPLVQHPLVPVEETSPPRGAL
ncbi:NUDIX domain-containing protein [Streptomyces sp. RS10V-4]|uniref:NUDIX domain-containing protein n=1 Tax=Streptomyces rhizoryzae TaxID=2932493 RepID=UPI002005B4E8|nr:NUDIX domain-containing protein [Streptomyces rhizoryzae]MCK7628002.1 NUDIX domain-containing protein [Streptomyces rhizoryzae]